MSQASADDSDVDDEIIIALSDYFDGALSPDKKRQVEAKIAADPAWKAVHDEMLGTQSASALSGLQKARAPEKFDEVVTETIHKRSAGRFFARKTFGDRVPFGLLLVIALIVIGTIAYVLWSSSTGSLKVHSDPAPQKPTPQIIERP